MDLVYYACSRIKGDSQMCIVTQSYRLYSVTQPDTGQAHGPMLANLQRLTALTGQGSSLTLERSVSDRREV